MEAGVTTGKEHDVSLETIRSWWKVPAVAHFCSLFRSTFKLPDFEIEELEEALYQDSVTDTSQFLVDLLVALLKGSFETDDIDISNYSDYLRDICNVHWEKENRVNPLNNEDTRFQSLSTLMKVEILYTLCDYRLDAEDVSILKDYDGETLRVEPLGQDGKGAFYWYFYGTRLYREDVPPPRPPKIKKKKKKKKRPDPPPKQRKQKTKTTAASKKGKGKQKQGTKGKGNQKKRSRTQTSESSSDSDEDDDDVPLAKMASPPRKKQKGAPVTKKGGKANMKEKPSSKPGSNKKSVSKVAKKLAVKTKKAATSSKQSNAGKGKRGAKKDNVEKKTTVKRGRGQSRGTKSGTKNNQSESDEGLSLADLKRCKGGAKTGGRGKKTKGGRNGRGDEESSEDDSDSPLAKKSKKLADSSSSWRSAEESSSSSDSSSSEDEPEPPKWQVICETEEDWQKLTDSFKKTRVKCERELYQVLSENFLPEIHSLFVAKERELRRKLQDLAPKRTSSRIAVKKSKLEEEEKLKALMEYEEEQRKKAEEASRREYLLQERRRKVQAEERRKVEGDKHERDEFRRKRAFEREMRLNCRQNPAKRKKKQLYDGFKKVLETVKKHPDAWPFIDPVQESFAPAYYDIIQHPMDISTVEVKVQEEMYRSKAKFEADMELIFSNCVEYNGPESEYTMMGANVASCFQEALDQHFPPGSFSDGELSDIASDQDSAYCLSYPRELRRRRKALNYTEMESTSDSGDTGRDEDDDDDLKGEVKVFPSYMAEKSMNSEKRDKDSSPTQKDSCDEKCPTGNVKGDEVRDKKAEEEKNEKTPAEGQSSNCLPGAKETTVKSVSPKGANQTKGKENERGADNTKKKSPSKSKTPKVGMAGDKLEVTAKEKIQNNSENHNYSVFSQSNLVNSSELTSLQRLEAITDRLGKSLSKIGSENQAGDAKVDSGVSCDISPDKTQQSKDKPVSEESKLSTPVVSSKEDRKPSIKSIVQQASVNKEHGHVLSHRTTTALKIKSESDSHQSCSGATARSPKIANAGSGSPLVVPSNLATVYNPGATTKASFTNQSSTSHMVSGFHSPLASSSSSPAPNSYLSLLGTQPGLKSSSPAGEGDASRSLGPFRSGGNKHFSAFHSVGKDHGLSRTVQNAAGISQHSLQSSLVPSTPATPTGVAGVGNQPNAKSGQYGTMGPIMSTFASPQSQSSKPSDSNSAFQPAKVYPNQPTIIRPVSRYPAQAQTIRQGQFLLPPGAIANQGSTQGPQLNILQIASAPSLTLNIQPNGLLNNSSMLNVSQNRGTVPAMYQQGNMGQMGNHVVQNNLPPKPTLVVQYQGNGGESPGYGGTQFRTSYQ